MQEFGIPGIPRVFSNACASGANAIGHAFREVRAGAAEIAVCGGYDPLSEFVFAGFHSLQALSPGLCRPFDRNRDGLALGEGAVRDAHPQVGLGRQRLAQPGQALRLLRVQGHNAGSAAVREVVETSARLGIGFLTLTHVKVSPDLQQARVYYTTLGDDTARRDTSRALTRATLALFPL